MPVFLTWFFLYAKLIVPIAVSVNELWVVPTYERYGLELIQTEDQNWRVDTELFLATKPYKHNSYHPKLKVNGVTSIKLGDYKSLTFCLPIFWLLVLAFKPKPKVLFYGSVYLFLFITFSVGLNIFYQLTKLLSESSDMVRVLQSGYIFVPDKPPQWLFKSLKPLLDASGHLLVLVAPIVLWLKLNWTEFNQSFETIVKVNKR